MWTALGRELDWKRAAPCREKPGISPPRLQHQPAMLLPPSSPEPGTLPHWGFNIFLCGEGWWRQMVYSTAPLWEEKEGSPCFRGRSPQPAMGHRAPGPPKHPSPGRPCPGGSPEGLSSLLSSLLAPLGRPRSQQTLPFPAQPSLRTLDSPRMGTPACLPSSVGAKPQDEVGGPPRLPRAGFSLWTLRSLASGRSSEPPRETSGRWEGRGLCAP